MEKLKLVDESGDKKYFTIIPNYILNHSTIWDRDVYIQMKRITGESGTCWVSQKRLSNQCGISINRLKKSISYLVKHNWIKLIGKKEVLTRGGIQVVNEYRIIDLWDLNNSYYKDKGVSLNDTPTAKGVSRNDTGGYHENAKGVSPDDDKEEPLNNININNNLAATSAADKDPRINELLNEFKPVNPTLNFGNKTQRKALEEMVKQFGYEKVLNTIRYAVSIQGNPYSPVITTPYQLKENMGKLMIYYQKENNQAKTFGETIL